ncbi:MAG TPA: FkbM family methyltransferase, partial [Pirellulaceae bacterium]|nr:FkbM family methyltransferase [Pirellulaceae bacterium]
PLAEFWRPASAGPGRPGFADGHCGTLAYLRAVWERQTCYPDCSLGEDVAFLRPALVAGCRFEPVPAELDFVYVRHGGNVSDLAGSWQEQGEEMSQVPRELAGVLPLYQRLGPQLAKPRQPAQLGRAERLAPDGHWLDQLRAQAPRRAESVQRCQLEPPLAELRGPPRPRPPHWDLQPEVIEAHRRLLDEAVGEALASSPPTTSEGRGIVTLGGTSKYFAAAWVMVSVLRKLGCTLPVEWWYLGPEELDPKMVRLAQSLPGVTCIDLRQRLAQVGRTPRMLGCWEAKVWAIMFSRFAEVLFLDADQVPVRNPAYLFDDPAYRRAGAVFWPDFLPFGWTVDADAFGVAGLPLPGNRRRPDWRNPTDYEPFETGQILVEKSRHWPALELTRHINDHSDFWFPAAAKGHHAWHIYGDKDTFFLAWQRLRASFAMPSGPIFTGSDKAGAFIQQDLAGQPIFQHRVQPATKWVLHGENHQPPVFQHHELCLAALDELRRRWPGHPYEPGDEDERERELSGSLSGRHIWFRAPSQPASIELASQGRTGDPLLHWSVRTFGGSRPEGVLVIASRDKALAFLGRDHWGQWVNHGTQDFLTPAPPAGFELPLAREELAMFNDIVRLNEYRLPDRFDARHFIIDVGGHCGSFAFACLARGVGRVVSIEPIPANFALLQQNLRSFGERSSVLNAAVWPTPGTVRLEQKEGARHSGGWSVIGTTAGIPAVTINLDDLVTAPVRLIKLDCEGAEWPILGAFTRWDLVEAWCGEYHHTQLDVARDGLRAIFEPHGYEVTVEGHPFAAELGHFWAARPPSVQKKALLVLGPESSGTRYLTHLIESSGVWRDPGNCAPPRLPNDWHVVVPLSAPSRIVLSRSLPVAGVWFDPQEVLAQLRAAGYEPTVLIPVRAQPAAEASQAFRGHAS